MAYMKSNVTPDERTTVGIKADAEVYNQFRDLCRKEGIPMGVLFETFMKEYVNGMELPLNQESKAFLQCGAVVRKEIAEQFKSACKQNKVAIRLVLESFMSQYNQGRYELVLREKD